MKISKLVLALGAAATMFSWSVGAEEQLDIGTTSSTAITTSTPAPASTSTSTSAEQATAPKDHKMRIVVIAKGFQHQFWKAVERGTQKAAEEFNVDVVFEGPDTESDVYQQVAFFNEAVASKPDAICLAALDTKALMRGINTAQKEGIPLIGFDSGVPDAPEGAIVATAATNNYAAGDVSSYFLYERLADKLEAATPQKPVRIGVVAQDNYSSSIVMRTQGFIDGMINLMGAEKVSVEGHPDFRKERSGASIILDVAIPNESNNTEAAAVVSTLLMKKDLLAIYGSNEFATNAIINANAKVNVVGELEGQVYGMGFDSGKKAITAMEDGILSGAITQNPVQIGYQAVRIAVDYLQGKKVYNIDTGALWYDVYNMEHPQIAACLYH